MADKKSKEIVLLKDKLDHIFKNFGPNFNITGKNFLVKLAKDEKKIDYNNLFFEIGDRSVARSVDSLDEIGSLTILTILWKLLLLQKLKFIFFKAITVLKKIISGMKTDITDQSEELKKKIFAEKENVLSNAEMLFKKRGELINQFSKKNIVWKGEKFYDAPKKSEESILEKSKQK